MLRKLYANKFMVFDEVNRSLKDKLSVSLNNLLQQQIQLVLKKQVSNIWRNEFCNHRERPLEAVAGVWSFAFAISENSPS